MEYIWLINLVSRDNRSRVGASKMEEEQAGNIGFKSRCVAGREMVAKWHVILERAIIGGEYRPARFWNIRRSNGYVYIHIDSGKESASLESAGGNIEKVLTVLH